MEIGGLTSLILEKNDTYLETPTPLKYLQTRLAMHVNRSFMCTDIVNSISLVDIKNNQITGVAYV